MKTILILSSILFISVTANAQYNRYRRRDNRYYNNSNDWTVKLLLNSTSNPFKANPGIIGLALPYIYSGTNIPQKAVFDKQIGVLSSLIWGIGLEIGSKKGYGDFSFATNGNASNFSFGFGGRIMSRNNRFGLRIGLNFNVNEQTINLGSVDNRGQYVNIDGVLFNPTFTYRTGGRHGHYVTTNSDRVNVNYDVKNYNLSPKIGFEYMIKNQRVTFRLNVMYNLLTNMNESIKLQQLDRYRNSGKSSTLNISTLEYNYISIGNNQVTEPFSLNKLMIGFDIGFRINWK